MTARTVRIADLEAVIREMRGVEGARIIADHQGSIEEIHVLVRGDRGAKQIVRDIESALMAKFGLKIDHKKVSVAQAGSASAPAPSGNGKHSVAKPMGTPRLELADISILIENSQIEATVRLGFGGRIHEGSASGPNTPRNQLRLMGQATVQAVESALEAPDTVLVEEIILTKLPGERAAVNALICLIGRSGEEHLLGAALVKQDPAKAAVQATLDALNRRFGMLAPSSPEAESVVQTRSNGQRRNGAAADGGLFEEKAPAE